MIFKETTYDLYLLYKTLFALTYMIKYLFCMKTKVEMLPHYLYTMLLILKSFLKTRVEMLQSFANQRFYCMKTRIEWLQKKFHSLYLISNACTFRLALKFWLENKNLKTNHINFISEFIMSYADIVRSPSGLSEEMADTTLEGPNDSMETIVGEDLGNNNWMAGIAGAGADTAVSPPCHNDGAGARTAASGAEIVPAKTSGVGTAASGAETTPGNPEGEVTGALQGAESDPSKNPGSEKKRGPKRSGQRRKRVEANKAKAGEKTEKKEAEKEKASWAEVAARGFPTLLLENGGRGMEHEDYLEFFQQLGDWVIEEETTCQQSYILKSGLREGGISVIFKHPEGIQWLKNHVDKLAALKEGDTGYTVYGPGEKPYTLFTVYTSDTKAVIRKDRFVKILWKNNPDLHKQNTIEGEIKVLGGFPLKEIQG